MAVKWVGRIEVSTSRLWSPWNTKWYPRSFSEQVVKSAFELPWEATLPRVEQALHGRAWSATGPVKRVDVSTDGGATWQRARLHEPNRRSAWVRFSLPWTPSRSARSS